MKTWQRLRAISWLPLAFTFGGWVVFASQTWRYIHTQVSILDEGNYLVKGLMMVDGRLFLYQDYGSWSNHMPLSFLIPGLILDWFGPSLETARFFAYFLSLLFLLGIWIVAKRWGGHWWGAFAVWAVAFNPAVLKIFSTMTSQVLVACLLVWILVFILAKERALWQLVVGSILMGMMLLTRENMVIMLPFILLYIGWQHGYRKLIWSGLSFGIVVLIGFAIYWPGIMRVWAAWLPVDFLPFMKSFQAPEGISLWDPQVDFLGRLLSFFSAIRYHFVAVVGVLATILLWPKRDKWPSSDHFKASVFLLISFIAMFMAHAWVTVGFSFNTNEAYSRSYCVFCFPVYLGFFSFLGILLIVISAPSWRRELPGWLQVLITALILFISAGVGYSTFETFGELWAGWEIPRVKLGRILPGSVPLWGVLENLGGITFNQSRRLIPTVVGLLMGIFLFIFSGLVRFTKIVGKVSFGYIFLVVFLITGFLFSITQFLGGGYQNYDCGSDVLASYSKLGDNLSALIPRGSLVYWQGGLSPAPLLYLPEVKVFGPQLNQDYSYHLSGETDALYKYGFWNRELAEKWLSEADYALVVTRYYQGWLKETLQFEDQFELMGIAPPTVLCEPDEYIHIYKRID